MRSQDIWLAILTGLGRYCQGKKFDARMRFDLPWVLRSIIKLSRWYIHICFFLSFPCQSSLSYYKRKRNLTGICRPHACTDTVALPNTWKVKRGVRFLRKGYVWPTSLQQMASSFGLHESGQFPDFTSSQSISFRTQYW